MFRIVFVTIITTIIISSCSSPGDKYFIASYYFPNYHVDARNAERFGDGWVEWELVKNAKPRFPGHQQPNVPAWGYTDEANPAHMAQKIDAAADHGVDAFIFDWYYYDDGLFLAVPRGQRIFDAAVQGSENQGLHGRAQRNDLFR